MGGRRSKKAYWHKVEWVKVQHNGKCAWLLECHCAAAWGRSENLYTRSKPPRQQRFRCPSCWPESE